MASFADGRIPLVLTVGVYQENARHLKHREEVCNLVEIKVEHEMDKVISEIRNLKTDVDNKFNTLKFMITLLTLIVSISLALGTIFKFFN